MTVKLKMLRLYGLSLRAWFRDVWKQNPDVRMCCDGHECGCYGSTYRDMWEHLLATPHPTPRR